MSNFQVNLLDSNVEFERMMRKYEQLPRVTKETFVSGGGKVQTVVAQQTSLVVDKKVVVSAPKRASTMLVKFAKPPVKTETSTAPPMRAANKALQSILVSSKPVSQAWHNVDPGGKKVFKGVLDAFDVTAEMVKEARLGIRGGKKKLVGKPMLISEVVVDDAPAAVSQKQTRTFVLSNEDVAKCDKKAAALLVDKQLLDVEVESVKDCIRESAEEVLSSVSTAGWLRVESKKICIQVSCPMPHAVIPFWRTLGCLQGPLSGVEIPEVISTDQAFVRLVGAIEQGVRTFGREFGHTWKLLTLVDAIAAGSSYGVTELGRAYFVLRMGELHSHLSAYFVRKDSGAVLVSEGLTSGERLSDELLLNRGTRRSQAAELERDMRSAFTYVLRANGGNIIEVCEDWISRAPHVVTNSQYPVVHVHSLFSGESVVLDRSNPHYLNPVGHMLLQVGLPPIRGKEQHYAWLQSLGQVNVASLSNLVHLIVGIIAVVSSYGVDIILWRKYVMQILEVFSRTFTEDLSVVYVGAIVERAREIVNDGSEEADELARVVDAAWKREQEENRSEGDSSWK